MCLIPPNIPLKCQVHVNIEGNLVLHSMSSCDFEELPAVIARCRVRIELSSVNLSLIEQRESNKRPSNGIASNEFFSLKLFFLPYTQTVK